MGEGLQKLMVCALLWNSMSSMGLRLHLLGTELPQQSVMNLLEGATYPHHPVMLQVDLSYSKLEPEFLTEWNGLKVPARFDCDNFNMGMHWSSHYYFYEVPTRWYA